VQTNLPPNKESMLNRNKKNLQKALILFFLISISSCANNKTITLANGKKVSEKKFRKMTHKAFEDSFGKMTEDEIKLFDSVNIIIDTSH